MKTFSLDEKPVFAVDENYLIPVSDHLLRLKPIPPSRMFLINKSLKTYKLKYPNGIAFDASQGDGGASLPGVPKDILEEAARLQISQGTAYDMPFGNSEFRRSIIEDYWKIDSDIQIGPTNVLATVGGRDALVKAYQGMLALGYGRQGDVLIVSRVPWISYNWGPYGIGANVLYAPGKAEEGWAYSEDTLRETIQFAADRGRKVAGLVITNPDNPTGMTLPMDKQVLLAKVALESGVAYVLLDWMYHYITDESPNDLNTFLRNFDPQEKDKLIILDGITKSLGGSNIRNAHLIAAEKFISYLVAMASHTVIPSFYSFAVAIAAYKMGYQKASRSIVDPTNASRKILLEFLNAHNFKYIAGKGYYAFIHVGEWLAKQNWVDSEPLGQYLAEEHGLAIVPGAFFSRFGGEWIRFSYATPPEKTLGALTKLLEGLTSLG